MIRRLQSVVNLIYYLWRGEVSLAFTYWVVGIAGNFVVFALPLLTLDVFKGGLNTLHFIHLGISFAYFAFSAVCITRAAGSTSRPKTWPF